MLEQAPTKETVLPNIPKQSFSIDNQTEPFDESIPSSEPQPLPFPFNQRTYCRYEPIEKRIDSIRVLVMNNLLRDENDLSELGAKELGKKAASELTRERHISTLALENINNNIKRLVKNPESKNVHLSEIAEAAEEYQPDAIVMSGTLRDFDFYKQEHLDNFTHFIKTTHIPVLGICGAHQLIGYSFGAKIITLDNLEPHQKRNNRTVEYQYRFIRITDRNDPIFKGVNDEESGIWQDYTKEAGILRVWQNHGLQLDRVPEGFRLLATAYLCKNQMMVKRTEGQMIYTVQYHLEKSFEDWNKNRTRWEHPNESRDGRVIFENFLMLSLKHKTKSKK
jgi:GMP synthase-like glutamine amidotransferase